MPPIIRGFCCFTFEESSFIQINRDREQLCAENRTAASFLPASRTCVASQRWRACGLSSNMRRAAMPAATQSIAPFYPHPRVRLDVADISGLPAVLRHDPKLTADAPIWRIQKILL